MFKLLTPLRHRNTGQVGSSLELLRDAAHQALAGHRSVARGAGPRATGRRLSTAAGVHRMDVSAGDSSGWPPALTDPHAGAVVAERLAGR